MTDWRLQKNMKFENGSIKNKQLGEHREKRFKNSEQSFSNL